MIEDSQIAGQRIETPNAGDGRRFFIFVELRIEMSLSSARAVRRKNNPPVRSIDRRHIVEIRRLIGNLRNDRRLTFGEICDLVYLPMEGGDLELLRRRSDDHAKDCLGARPVDARLAHCDRSRALKAGISEAGSARHILEGAARILNEEIAAARRY